MEALKIKSCNIGYDTYHEDIIFGNRGLAFKSPDAYKYFANKCEAVKKEMSRLLNIVLDKEVSEKFEKNENSIKLNEREILSFKKNAFETCVFLQKDENVNYLDFLIKQIINNLILAHKTKTLLRISRTKGNYGRGKRYNNHHYKPFMFVIDALILLGYIDRKRANISRYRKYETRISFTSKGSLFFCDQIESVNKIEETDRKLIVLTDKDKRINAKGKKTIIIPITEKKDIDKSKELASKVELYNNYYKTCKFTLKLKDAVFDNGFFIEELYRNYITNKISDLKIEYSITIKNKIVKIDNILKYINRKVNVINIDNDKLPKILIKKLKERRRIMNKVYELNKLEGIIYREDTDEPIVFRGLTRTVSEEEHNEIDKEYNKLIEIDKYKKKTSNMHVIVHSLEFKINHTDLFRVFSRRSLDKHGRFYGPLYQSMNKLMRKSIYLNNDIPMDSLDFGSFHTVMGYHLNMKECIDKPYNVKGCQSWRKYLKDVAMVTLNAMDITSSKKALQKKFRENHNVHISQENCVKVIQDFADYHDGIRNYLNSDFAIDAMNIDSQIMDDCLYELMIRQNIPVLPVHDELYFPVNKGKIVWDQMVQSYRKILKKVLVKRGVLKEDDALPDYIIPVLPQVNEMSELA